MEITRREAIKLGVAAGVLGGVSGVLLKAAAESPETKSEGALSVVSVPSICGMCMAQCAIWVDVVNGKPVRIRPNTNAPTSAIGICARGVSGTFNTWLNPDAIKKPMAARHWWTGLRARSAGRRLSVSWPRAAADTTTWWKSTGTLP